MGCIMERDQFAFDYRKFEDLIVCIAEQATDIGLTKLEKLLYLCDFIAVERIGHPVTGEVYRNFDLGPVPKHIKAVLKGMSERLQEETISMKSGRKFVKFKVLVASDLSRRFAPEEQELIL